MGTDLAAKTRGITQTATSGSRLQDKIPGVYPSTPPPLPVSPRGVVEIMAEVVLQIRTVIGPNGYDVVES